MKKTHRVLSVISAFLAVMMLFALLPQSAAALTYKGSTSYKSGPYYERLCAVELTGDSRTDIVNIAKSQVGYFEGSNSNELSGTVNGSNNYTEYGRWYGMQDMWCAIFVSWCAYVAGVPESVVLKHAYTPTGLSWFQNKGQAYSRADVAAGKYTPQPGDIIYFKSPRNNNPTNHVGIVTEYKNRTVYTVEGNSSLVGIDTNGGAVAAKSHSIDDTYIVYICRPDYDLSPVLSTFKTQLDEYSAVKSGVSVRGWCYYTRTKARTMEIHVYIGGPLSDKDAEAHTDILADTYRPDVDAAYNCGENHGYEATVKTKLSGKQPVYVYAFNPYTNEYSLISKFTADIPAADKGDVNIDYSVNNKDVVELFRYISDNVNDLTDTFYDFNGDGKVNNKDVTLLFRYINSN